MRIGGMVEVGSTIFDFERVWLGFFTLNSSVFASHGGNLEVTNCDFKMDSVA